MPGGPQSCPLGDSPSSLGATSPLLLSLLELLALLVNVGHFMADEDGYKEYVAILTVYLTHKFLRFVVSN